MYKDTEKINIVNENTKLPTEILLKVFNLVNDLNYKISLFSYYIIQLLEPREEIKFIEYENHSQNPQVISGDLKNSKDSLLKPSSNKLIKMKPKKVIRRPSLEQSLQFKDFREFKDKELTDPDLEELNQDFKGSKELFNLKESKEFKAMKGISDYKDMKQQKLQLLNEEELENLYVLIRDKIILETKNKTLENNNPDNYYPSQNTVNEMRIKSPKSPKNQNIDELNDYMDLVKIPELTGFYEEVDESK